ncbi:MAG: phosphoglycerate kinase [Patescibacteria group bacterium]
MNLPKIDNLEVSGKRVIVRLDLDVDQDYSRLESAKETLDFLVRNKAKIIIIGHKGRPSHEEKLSLGPLAEKISQLVNKNVAFSETLNIPDTGVVLVENLRFNPGEETNNEAFAKNLASLADFYVNEAFAVSHRSHASIIGIPRFLPHAAGFHFIAEVENLSKILETPKRPLLFIISGIKKDKVGMIERSKSVADLILVAGRLPEYLGEDYKDDKKVIVADLIPDKEDITMNSIERFESEIAKAGTIVLAGVPGKYEDEGHRQGTEKIFKAVANSSAFKVAGGGDTEAALTIFGLTDKFDWISVGGGAMLEFLINGTLVGIEALR